MKDVSTHLQELQKVRRGARHPLLHEIHLAHGISKKTLFFVKEYGPHSHIARTIIRESVKVILFASIISSFGGLALEQIKYVFLSIAPLIVLLPALNSLVGDAGILVSTHFSRLLYEGKIHPRWWKSRELHHLFFQQIVLGFIFALAGAALSLAIAPAFLAEGGVSNAAKLFLVVLIDILVLTLLLFVVAVVAGTYFYKKDEDPDNFLIPITTSVADFGNMLLLAGLVLLFF